MRKTHQEGIAMFMLRLTGMTGLGERMRDREQEHLKWHLHMCKIWLW